MMMAMAVAATAMVIDPAQLGGDDTLAALSGDDLPISAAPMPLNPDDPGMDRLGPLRFLGAVHVRSSDKEFGGISGLRATDDGHFLAVTDTGNWLSFQSYEKDGQLIGIRNVRMRPIIMTNGKPAPRKQDGDAEALEWDPLTGHASVVFENGHRILHWKGIDPRKPETLDTVARRAERLPQMSDWPANGGGEAMVAWKASDGTPTRLIISEDVVLADGHRLAVLTHDMTSHYVGVEGVDEHKPTDAVMLDETRMLVLHRRFNLKGAGAAISLVDLAPLHAETPATRLKAKLLARWEAPVLLDNMEGIAVVREGERVFVYIVSDDNLMAFQRTLLMKFELELP
jgi:hypothetical protein